LETVPQVELYKSALTGYAWRPSFSFLRRVLHPRRMFWRNEGAKRRPIGFIEPCIPTRADKVPVGVAQDATIDGEVVVCDAAGVADFERLHSRAHDRLSFLYAFDLLTLDGVDVRPLALAERKDRLRELLQGFPPGRERRNLLCEDLRAEHESGTSRVAYGETRHCTLPKKTMITAIAQFERRR